MAQQLVEAHGYPVAAACELLELSPSSYYYVGQKGDESQLIADVKEVAGKYVRYGSRRVCHELRRAPYGYQINRKKIQRIMRQAKLLRSLKRKGPSTTDSDHAYRRYENLVKGIEITAPEQVWVCDLTYIRLGNGFVYLAIVLDVFTRAIRGWHLSRSLDHQLVLTALRMALADRVPEIHHSDQGVQYACYEYIQELSDHHIQISMSAIGKPEENGYAERFMRTIKEEEVDLSEYVTFADAYHQIGRFIEDVYNTKRIHSSLGYLTPIEFEADWLASQLVLGTP